MVKLAPAPAQVSAPANERLVCGALPDEATLAALWEGQRFPPAALRLADGRPLRVVYRGRRQRGAGPDFREAVLAVAGEGVRYGDVELHVRAADWRTHGHHHDPAYAGVILHVVFEPPGPGEPPASAPGGASIPTLALGPWVASRAGDLALWLAGPDRWREPCHGARAAMGEAGATAALQRLGLRRLQERAAHLRRTFDGPGAPSAQEVLHGALYEALGYPRNREPFRRLAILCRWAELRAALAVQPPDARHEVAEALLLRRAGLLNGDPRAAMAAGAWMRWGVRPENRPERRIAGAAALAARFVRVEGGPLAAVAAAAASSTEALLGALMVGADFSWGGGALIGRGRAVELATNAVLPVLLALAERDGDRDAAALIEERYVALPRPEPYGRTAVLERAIAAGGRTPVRGAAGQQALLYLQQHYCGRGKCGRCPLS